MVRFSKKEKIGGIIMNFWQTIKDIFHPNPKHKHVKVDLVFLIFYGIIVWRVAMNLFTSAGFIPWLWQDIHFWFTNIIWNLLALFGLVWLFRIYVQSLKHKDITAEDILQKLGQLPYVKTSVTYKELCRKYSVKE